MFENHTIHPRNIVCYRILHDADCECLAELVEDLIKEGWKPYGFPTLQDRCSYQAMVKYEN